MSLLVLRIEQLCFVGSWLLKNVLVDVVTLSNFDLGGFENSCQKLLVEKIKKSEFSTFFQALSDSSPL